MWSFGIRQWLCGIPALLPTLMTNVTWLGEHHGVWDCSTRVINCVKVTLVCAVRLSSQVGNCLFTHANYFET